MTRATNAAPQPTDRAVSPEERLSLVRNLIDERGAARIDELADDFGVSEMTIRRDLAELETLGVARRVRGGAIALGPEPFAARHRHQARAKARIAEKLLPLIPKVGTIALDASTTVHRLATSLAEARDLTIITNGLDSFQALSDTPGVQVNLTGGTQEPRTGSLVGPLAVRSVESLLYEVFIASSAAVDAAVGSSERSIEEAEVKRTFQASSQQVVLAVDHTKLDTRSPARWLNLSDIHLMVTDLDPSDARLDRYRDLVDLR